MSTRGENCSAAFIGSVGMATILPYRSRSAAFPQSFHRTLSSRQKSRVNSSQMEFENRNSKIGWRHVGSDCEPLTVDSSSLVSQRQRRVEFGCAPRRNVASDQEHRNQQQRDTCE